MRAATVRLRRVLWRANCGRKGFAGGKGGFVEVDLPIHQSARHEVVFYGVNAFGFHHEAVVSDVEHFDDTLYSYVAFSHSGKETVATQIVESVHVELAANQFVEKMLWIAVGENLYCRGELAVELIVKLLHEQEGEFFVAHALHEMPFEAVGHGAVAYVVEQHGNFDTLCLVGRDVATFVAQCLQGDSDEVEGAYRVGETGVATTGIDIRSGSQLFNAVEAYKIGVFHQRGDYALWNIDKSVYGVVDYHWRGYVLPG